MNAGQSVLVRRSLRVVFWLCLAWLLTLATLTGWGSWQESSPREYSLNPPTTRDRALQSIADTAGIPSSERAWLFWGPLALGLGAYWGRRFLALSEESEAQAEPSDREA